MLAEGIKKRGDRPRRAPESVPPYRAGGSRRGGTRTREPACSPAPAPGVTAATGRAARTATCVGAINDPAFLALISDQALRRYAITGRPDLGMPAYDGKARPDRRISSR